MFLDFSKAFENVDKRNGNDITDTINQDMQATHDWSVINGL